MIRLPNKLYSIRESTLWQMRMLHESIPEEGISVSALCEEHSKYAIDDIMDALTALYAINEIEMNNQIIKRHVTGDTL